MADHSRPKLLQLGHDQRLYIDTAVGVTEADYAQYTRNPGEPGGQGGAGGPPVTTSFPYYQDAYRIENLVFNSAGADGLKTITCEMINNVCPDPTNGLDGTNSFVLKQLSPTSIAYATENQVLGMLVPQAPQGAAGGRQIFAARLFNPIFGIQRQQTFYESDVGANTYLTRRLQLVATLSARPDPLSVQTMTATLTSNIPGPNGELTIGPVPLIETAVASSDFKNADGTFELRIDRFGINAVDSPTDFTVTAWSTLLAVSSEKIDAIESATGSLEFRTDLLTDDPPVLTNGDMALIGKTYSIKIVTTDQNLAAKPVKLQIFGFNKPYGRDDVALDTKDNFRLRDGFVEFLDDRTFEFHEGKPEFIWPSTGMGTGVYAVSGDQVVARLGGPGDPNVFTRIAVSKEISFSQPYGRDNRARQPAIYTSTSITPDRKLQIQIREGPGYKENASNIYNFLGVIDGSEPYFNDWDSAQVAIRWYKNNDAAANMPQNNRVPFQTGPYVPRTSPPATPADAQRDRSKPYVGETVRLKGGAKWDWMPGVNNGMVGKREVYAGLAIPDDVDGVDVVVVYTDLINGHNSDTDTGVSVFARDIADIVASWTGVKKDGMWLFRANDGAYGAEKDTQCAETNPNYRLPFKNPQPGQTISERDKTIKQVRDKLRERVGHTLQARNAITEDDGTGRLVETNGNDTGYDVEIDGASPTKRKAP